MTSSKPVLAISAIAPIVLLAIMIAFLLGPASTFLQFGVVLPEVSIEKIEFIENEIQATVRNTGPIGVNVVLADVNDRDQPSLDQTSTIQSFTFNELGLKTKGTSGLGKGLLLTHTIFHPVQKSTNRLIQIVYTLRFTVSEN